MTKTRKKPVRKNTVQISMSMAKETLDLVNELAKESGLNRSRYINETILESPQDGILKIEYKTQKQLEICVAIYSLQKEDPPTYLRIVDNNDTKKIEVGGMSFKFITQIIVVMQEHSEVVSIKLAYKKVPETPLIS